MNRIRAIKCLALAAVDSNAVRGSEQPLKVCKVNLQPLGPITGKYCLGHPLYLEYRERLVITDIHFLMADPGYYRSTRQQLHILGIAIVLQCFQL